MKKLLLFVLLLAGRVQAQFMINPYIYGGIPRNGLQLYWDAGLSASYPGSGTTIYDLSNNGRDGTFTGGVGYSSLSGGYLTFDGVDDKVANTTYGVKGLSACTIVIWKKQPNIGGGRVFESGGTSVSCMGFASNTFYWNAATYNIIISSSPSFSSWRCEVFIYTNGLQTAYVNGVLQAGVDYQSGSLNSPSGNRTVIGASVAYTFYSENHVGAFAIYDRALDAAEVLKFFDATKTRYGY